MPAPQPPTADFRLTGPILWLTQDADLLAAQLAGKALAWDASVPLRDDISTDEITPADICYYHDATLGEFVYVGLVCDGRRPITRNAVRNAGFAVSVSGRRRGKGSSREASPYAELAAGIRLVVAESFERIYRENCQNLGLLTTTDVDLLRRLTLGHAVSLAELTRDDGPVTREIVTRGGLFPYNLARLAGVTSPPSPTITARPLTLAYNLARLAGVTSPPSPTITARPLTLAEKILAAHWVRDLANDSIGVQSLEPGDEGFVRADLRFSHEYVTAMAAQLFHSALGPAARVKDPNSVLLFRDHLTFLDLTLESDDRLDLALALVEKQEAFAKTQGIRLYGEVPPLADERGGSEAICHAKILEYHALPGQLIVGTDSHTSHSGALGALAFGIGTTAIANAWLTRDVRLKVPPVVLVRLEGTLSLGVAAKDVMLQLLRHPEVRAGHLVGRIVEYAGTTVAAMSIDERATLTNMAAELGAFSAIVAPDRTVVRFLAEERRIPLVEAQRLIAGLTSDAGAAYERVITLDATTLRPMIALPGDPGNGIVLDELNESVPIDIAYAGSCTGGKCADMDMYAAVFAAAVAFGERVHPDVRCYVQFGSQEVKRYAEARGYVEVFRAVGAEILDPGCGACINAGPGASRDRETVSISAINRNFPGRSGPGQVYLASPYTVAASALAGVIAEWRRPTPIP